MKCSDLKELLSAYADGELSRTQREFVEEHISSCLNCRAVLNAYKTVNQKLASLRETPALSDITTGTMLKIKEKYARKPSKKWLRPVLALAAVAAFVAVLFSGVLDTAGTTGGAMSPPPLTWEKLNLILNLFYLAAFLIMRGRILANNMYTRLLAGIGSILFGAIGIGIGLPESLIGHPEKLLIMGTVSIFGMIMGIVYILKRNINRWAAAIGVFLCLIVLVLEAIMFIGYPIPQIWLTVVTVAIPVGIIIYAFQRELKQPPQIWLRLALVITILMIFIAVLLAAQYRGIEIPRTSGAMSLVPLSYVILTGVGWLSLLLGIIIMLGLVLRNKFAWAVADFGSMLFGIIGWYIGLYGLTTLKSDVFLGMGIIPVFGLVMGIGSFKKRADRRWLALTGVVLCISALVLDTIFLIGYPVTHAWIIAATVVIPVGIILSAFHHEIKTSRERIYRSDSVSTDSQKSRRKWTHPSLITMPLSIFLLVVMVGGFVAGMGGMSPPPPQPPAVVADGNGGAFIFWVETPYNYSTGLYANHIDDTGKYLWGKEGKHLAMGRVSPPEAISDGAGGAIVAWVDDNNLHVERLDFIGDSMWTWEEVNSRLSLLGITADSSGGAIILWQDRNEQVYTQRISVEGADLWGEAGTFIGKIQNAYAGMPLVSDGSGGAGVIWQDPLRKGVFVQRVNPVGELFWAEGGVSVTSLTGEKDRPQLINDGDGNLIVAWSEITNDAGFRQTAYVQKLDEQGNRLWGEQGILLDSDQTFLRDPKLTADSSGGCIVTWVKNGNIYAQRFDSTGAIQWRESGVRVSDVSQHSRSPDLGLVYIVSDGNGYSTVIWVADRYVSGRHKSQVYAQKLSPDSQRLWSDGVEVYQNAPFRAIGYSDVTSDGEGGFTISTRVSEGTSNTDSVYAQRIMEENLLWGEGGLEIQLKHSSPVLPIMASIIMVVTIMMLVGIFRRNRFIGIFVVITPVLIGIAALFGNLLLSGPFGYSHSWAYVLDTPVNVIALETTTLAGLSIAAVGIWKRTITKWLMIPILVFCVLVAAITSLILFT